MAFLASHGGHGPIGLHDQLLVGFELLLSGGSVNADFQGNGLSQELPLHTNGQHLGSFVPHVHPRQHLVGSVVRVAKHFTWSDCGKVSQTILLEDGHHLVHLLVDS